MNDRPDRAAAIETARPSYQPTLLQRMSAAESRRARAIAHEAVLAVIG
jgi:hypothetical protein